MTKNRRSEAHYDALNDQRRVDSTDRPATLLDQAYGPNSIEWPERRPTVWAWIQWAERPAERLPAVAKGWNDRVVIVEWYGPTGARETVVWRNAVSRREITNGATRPADPPTEQPG